MGRPASSLAEAVKVAATVVVAGPAVAAAAWAGPRLRRPQNWADFLGCGVSPRQDQAVQDLVAELGVRRLLVRLPLWDRRAQAATRSLIEALPHCRWHVVIPQDRRAVCQPQHWRDEVLGLARDLPPQVESLQIGHAVNRLKWGCATIGEYLDLYAACHDVLRMERPDLTLLGSGVIDFEPVATLRSLVNGRQFRFDACAAALYVDRRGGPDGRQYGLFDFAAKLRTVAAMVAAAPRCGKRLWITEVNWPLQGTAPWAPTSEAECVDEEAAGAHLDAYLGIAWDSGLVERVYPWQLIAPGYGLVDSRGGLHRRSSFKVLKQRLSVP
jgi:hypothetical protein